MKTSCELQNEPLVENQMAESAKRTSFGTMEAHR
jgi:hypothetical protein